MKKLFLSFLIAFSLNASAQYNWDYGLMLGVTNYMGDIGGPNAKPIRVQLARLNVGGGFFVRYRVSPLISVKGSFSYIRISGADSLSESPERIARNLSFRNAIYEFAVVPEFHFFQTKDFGRSGRYTTFFNAYGFAGVGLAFHNPQAQLGSRWVNLRPLQTEGTNYSSLIPVFPIGLGTHFTFKRKLRVGVEMGIRMTFFDYLDDISDDYLTDDELAEIGNSADGDFQQLQNRIDIDYINANPEEFGEGYRQGGEAGGIRGNPESNDWYFFTSVNVGYVIKGNSNFYRSRYNYARGRKKKRRRSRAKF